VAIARQSAKKEKKNLKETILHLKNSKSNSCSTTTTTTTTSTNGGGEKLKDPKEQYVRPVQIPFGERDRILLVGEG
jgi:hypothetical protein